MPSSISRKKPTTFCVEPVTHAVNAMNHADAAAGGLWTLKPGATREIRMTIRCVDQGDVHLDVWCLESARRGRSR